MGANTQVNGSLESKIILFDGVCNLCNASVNFVIDRDPDHRFKFASLQSDFGSKKLKAEGKDPSELSSIVFIEGDHLYHKSTAALKVARQLSGGWPLLYVFIIIPRFLRDMIYDLIAKNRYRWFGRQDACRMPSPDVQTRFIDS